MPRPSYLMKAIARHRGKVKKITGAHKREVGAMAKGHKEALKKRTIAVGAGGAAAAGATGLGAYALGKRKSQGRSYHQGYPKMASMIEKIAKGKYGLKYHAAKKQVKMKHGGMVYGKKGKKMGEGGMVY